MTDMVNHPPHYASKDPRFETIEIIESYGFDESFHLGNALKYLMRAHKKGAYLQDLKKARWYLHRFVNIFGDATEETLGDMFVALDSSLLVAPIEDVLEAIEVPGPSNHGIIVAELLAVAAFPRPGDSFKRCLAALEMTIDELELQQSRVA